MTIGTSSMEIITNREASDICSSSKRLNGRVAVITGGARGIGAATAKIFARNGAAVIVADILDDLGAELADLTGGRYIHCDVGKESDVKSAIDLALSWKGRLDIMFNNAGIAGVEGSITRFNMEESKRLVAVNVDGVIHGIKHAARAMIGGGGGGSIICTSSTAAIMGGLGSHAYTLTKATIVGLARSAACELGLHGIRVNCISPHGVPTEILVNAFRRIVGKEDFGVEDVEKIVGETGSLLRGRCGRVEDVAEAALFLASEEASGFITGQNLVLDGGYTCASGSMSFIYN